jgi:hypothetical protein
VSGRKENVCSGLKQIEDCFSVHLKEGYNYLGAMEANFFPYILTITVLINKYIFEYLMYANHHKEIKDSYEPSLDFPRI